MAYDTPVIGGGGDHANTLRLWSARAIEKLHLDDFNRGDHVGALRDRVRTEAVSRVLYPGDDSAGRVRNCGCGRSFSSPAHRCRIW